ncbi:hypothetical protein CWO01_10995 [Vibrio splendidus]|uniref:hypothetical protein n=1 Tax=Vibrio splendidus TaxID=29497 RepID=UPI000D343AE4|nr:hypothetical protein [Vibrio splendidus]PTP62290.1 hypothetical protein CWO01_10995 [Vibrio splendidus]
MNSRNTTGKQAISNKEPKYKPVSSVIIFTLLSLTLFTLLKEGFISEPSFVTLVLGVTLLSFGILVLDFMKEIDFKGFKLTLREIKETETNITNLAKATLELSKASEDKFSEWVTEDTPKINERYYSAINELEKLTSEK